MQSEICFLLQDFEALVGRPLKACAAFFGEVHDFRTDGGWGIQEDCRDENLLSAERRQNVSQQIYVEQSAV